MPAILEQDASVNDYSTNDSHIHIDHTAKARRDRLQLTLKPGETDEAIAPGTRYQCAQCNPDGTLAPVDRPSNQTYDMTFAARKRDEMDDLKRELAEMKSLLRDQLAARKPKAPSATP